MFRPSPSELLRHVLRVLIPLSLLLTGYIYFYPFFGQCAFPLPATLNRPSDTKAQDEATAAFAQTLSLHLPARIASALNGSFPSSKLGLRNLTVVPTRPLAPFRLLALGDPQLEGDTSIPNAYSTSSFPHLVNAFNLATFRKTSSGPELEPTTNTPILRERVRQALHDAVDFWFLDIPNTVASIRKRVDLIGNDFYLAHIFRLMRWWTMPTHISVLGDLLGSQWVGDDEFERRAVRFWQRVARGTERVPDELALHPAGEYELSGYLDASPPSSNISSPWVNRVINVVGNHDIGYAGDITPERLARFERLFGKVNYELRFELHPDMLSPEAKLGIFDDVTNPDSDRLFPELRIINLNDMNLDTPAQSSEIQEQTYGFINAAINTASAVEFKGHFTVLLTHVPLHKPEGVCIDAPYFAFHDEDGSLKEQNLLSEGASQGLLEGIYGIHRNPEAPGGGMGRPGVIINGHDHEGCDSYHFLNQSEEITEEDRKWQAVRWPTAQEDDLVAKEGLPGIREVTVRSMMGDFGGNAGLLSAWFDEDSWEWRFEYTTCSFGRQHIWWAVHVLDIVTVISLAIYTALAMVEAATGEAVRWIRASKPTQAKVLSRDTNKDTQR